MRTCLVNDFSMKDFYVPGRRLFHDQSVLP